MSIFNINIGYIVNSYIFKMGSLYLVYMLAHFISSHLYIYFCVPLSLTGFLMSPFMTLTPQCQFLRWTIYHCGAHINIMWILVANWLVTKFDFYSKQ